MKKRILTLLVSGVLSITIAGCGKNKEGQESGKDTSTKVEDVIKGETTLSSKQVLEKIMAEIETVKQVPVEENLFKEQYSIDPSILDNYFVMSPMMMVHSSECAVFKVKDTKDIEKVKAGINKKIKYLEGIWSQYLPEQYELVQKNKIVVKNKYILFVIDENADKIVNNFNNLIK